MANNFRFIDIDQVEAKVRNLVYGYLRENELKIKNEHQYDTYYTIPALVIRICLTYYFDPSIFDSTEDNPAFILTGKYLNTITKRGVTGWNCSIYGKDWIPSTSDRQISWIIDIDKYIRHGGSIGFGVIKNQHSQSKIREFDYEHSYVIYTGGARFIDGKHSGIIDIVLYEKDRVNFTLDLKNRNITLDKNDGQMTSILVSKIPKSPETKYKFALTIHGHGNSVSIKKNTV